MRIRRLEVQNFRGIARAVLPDLADTVVVAGTNGSGKSALLDAIRLLKSFYGGYDQYEWRQWFSEFQIDLSADRRDLTRLFRDPNEPVRIEAVFELSPTEQEYLSNNAPALIDSLMQRDLAASNFGFFGRPVATELRQFSPEMQEQAARDSEIVRDAASQREHTLAASVMPDRRLDLTPSRLAEVLFQTYAPNILGVIEYHSASRYYQRESVGQVSLDLDNASAKRKQHMLYNWIEKYRNVKAELASTYVRELLASRANVQSSGENLNQTLSELFQTFFPGKSYDGPVPNADGSLSFPVRLASGETHDIDDLSSGEKEVLYGYLRLRAASPRNSVVLIDEPELHLNPVLIQGLPDFYHRHLGQSLDNQLWLVTHSDTLLRQSVDHPGFSVFHMTAARSATDSTQVGIVKAASDLDRAVIALVGDLATYRPHAPTVILEGGGDDEFDVRCCRRLFPDVAAQVNFVSGGHKRRVADLYEVLSRAAEQVGLGRFVAIVDADTNVAGRNSSYPEVRQWDRYHIENYLLEPSFVRAAANAIAGRNQFGDEAAVMQALRQVAERRADAAIRERLRDQVHLSLVEAIDLGGNQLSGSAAEAIRPALTATATRLQASAEQFLEGGGLDSLALRLQEETATALRDESWLERFPGRAILAGFVGDHLKGISYQAFRNLVLDQMAEAGFRPPGMAHVLSGVVDR